MDADEPAGRQMQMKEFAKIPKMGILAA